MGSNVAPEDYLPRGLQSLRDLGTLEAVSTVYRTAPFGPRGQPPFLNAAVALRTDLNPHQLRARLRELEGELGRVRSAERYAPRPIDLDICLYGDRIIQEEDFRIPDPDIFERPYLAVTLAEVAGGHVHPESGEPLRAIASRMAPDPPLTPDRQTSARFRTIWEQASR